MAHAGSLLVALLLLQLVFVPVLVLVHELGHAWVALASTRGKVTVHVGRPTSAIQADWERLSIRWSPLPMRGVSMAGCCICDLRGLTGGQLLRFLLAGPLTSLLAAIPLGLLALATGGHPRWLAGALFMAAFETLFLGLFNLFPARMPSEKKAPRRDGPKALAVLRASRARRGASASAS